MKGTSNSMSVLVFILLGLCLPAEAVLRQSGAAHEQPGQIKRLILKDGSYELVSQYSVQGDRVRYFSSERRAWEELPYALIDWAATEKYAGRQAEKCSESSDEALEKASKERKAEDAVTPLVAPGLRLPSPDAVYLLDVYQKKSELNRLTQSGADLKRNMGRNILRSVVNPIAGSRQTVELKGLRARIQSHVLRPVIYFAIDPEDPQMGYNSKTAKDHLRIVRCGKKKGNRIVITFNVAIYGKVKQQAQYIQTEIVPVSDYWVKVTPAAPLPPEEYALVEVDGKGLVNQFVWDFGVNPAAKPNPVVIQANPEKSEPVLIQKPRKKADP